MAESMWDFRFDHEVTQLDDSLIPEGGNIGPTEGFFIVYKVKRTFKNYPCEEISVEKTTLMQPICDIDQVYGPPDDLTTRFFIDNHLPLDKLEEIQNQVKTKAISWCIDSRNASAKVLLFHVKISTWASRYLPDDEESDDDGKVYVIDQADMEDDEEDDEDMDSVIDEEDMEDDEEMDRVITLSMQNDNQRVCFPADRFAAESLKKARYESAVFGMHTCRVCLDEFIKEEEVILMPCNHVYHRHCILEWLKENNVCPLCRFTMSVGY